MECGIRQPTDSYRLLLPSQGGSSAAALQSACGAAGDGLEGHAITDAWVNRRARDLRKTHQAANPLCLGKRQREKPHFEHSHRTHFFS
jgi:hypothetical protein